MQAAKHVYVAIASSSAVFAVWKLLQWRARKRAKSTVERIRNVIRLGPLIDPEDPRVRQRILFTATRRASKWISLSEAKQMAGQVGGVSVRKKPLLFLKPDYILKPLHTDHRGIREVAFYEAIYHAGHKKAQAYSVFMNGKEPKKNAIRQCGDLVDTLAVALAILFHDPVVTGSEEAIRKAWKKVKKEVDALSKLAKYTAPYYGLVGQNLADADNAPYCITEDAHLLLQDLTSNFSKPSVIDLKIGTQTFEPNASVDKIARETSKYPHQAVFGFRIVGMRVYEPGHPDADEDQYVFYDKMYGRSLGNREEVLGAFERYFSAGNFVIPGSEGPSGKTDDAEDTNNASGNGVGCALRTKTLSNLLWELRSLRRWFEDNESSLRFYASSLLIVYEGDTSKTPDSGLVSVKMIDFGRVRREERGDATCTNEGYQTGLQSLYGLLTELLGEAKHSE